MIQKVESDVDSSQVETLIFALKALKTALRLLRDGWFGFTAQVWCKVFKEVTRLKLLVVLEGAEGNIFGNPSATWFGFLVASRFCTERCITRLRLLVVLGDWGGDGQLSILPASLDPHSRPTHPSWTHPHPQNLQILAEAIFRHIEETFFCLDKFSLMDFHLSLQTDFELSRQLQDLSDSFKISGQFFYCPDFQPVTKDIYARHVLLLWQQKFTHSLSCRRESLYLGSFPDPLVSTWLVPK